MHSGKWIASKMKYIRTESRLYQYWYWSQRNVQWEKKIYEVFTFTQRNTYFSEKLVFDICKSKQNNIVFLSQRRRTNYQLCTYLPEANLLQLKYTTVNRLFYAMRSVFSRGKLDRKSSHDEVINKKLSYRRVTARCVVSTEILPIATQQCRNCLYDKSWPNRWYEVGDLVGGNAW